MLADVVARSPHYKDRTDYQADQFGRTPSVDQRTSWKYVNGGTTARDALYRAELHLSTKTETTGHSRDNRPLAVERRQSLSDSPQYRV